MVRMFIQRKLTKSRMYGSKVGLVEMQEAILFVSEV